LGETTGDGNARRWPARLWLVRHGESAGNVARMRAQAERADVIEIDVKRDVDVALSNLGRQQAEALGLAFARLPLAERPNVVFSSPYLRARQTLAQVEGARGLAADVGRPVFDERLREREFGILDRLTADGIAKLYPEQAQYRESLGKFYHRPPGGESWCDVILRLRSALDTLSLHHAGQRVLIICHEVVVSCLRYLLEEMTEDEILKIDAASDVANCAITEYRLHAGQGRLELVRYNDVAHLQETNAPITSEKDFSTAPR
jgi:broad specificity phosphatase PhoE